MSKRKKTGVCSKPNQKSQLIALTSRQLNQVNGGSGDPSGPEPDFGPDGYHRN